MGDYSVSDIYQGGYSSFKPNYGSTFVNYTMNASKLGITTDPRTANIMQDSSTKLNMGIKQIELALVSPEVFDSIPKQQLKEISRMSKLVGAEVSVHGPVLNSTGITQQGFSELNREEVERRISDVMIRSHDINPEGNSPVTFHAGEGILGSEWKTLGWGDKAREAKKIIAVDKESGKMIPLEEEEKFYPGGKGGEIIKKEYSPEENLKIINETEWDNKISQLFFNKERADEILEQNQTQIQQLPLAEMQEREKKGQDPLGGLTPTQQQAYIKMRDAQNYLSEINKTANGIFSKAYKFGNEEQQEALKQLSEDYRKDLEKNGGSVLGESKAMHKLLINLQNPEFAPEMFVPIEKFATDQSSKTFGNAAFNAYKQFGNTAPILSIENPPAGFGMSTGEDLKNLVIASRKQFADRVIKEKGISEREAEKLAEKFIGATWDVGHINMLRKQGFKDEDIVRESEKVAPFVKHVHLSDNFGFEHTELPMGMGNVPIKEIMEKLGQKGFDAKKIIEAGQWWQHFQTPPFKETLEAFGSPIYSMQMSPYWNQALGFQQGYFGGYGAMLPSINYESFGAGFSRLPSELGGQRQGAEGSRMSGRGME
ncbi:MAG: TIM barrel protein [Nanoarchaeota archaeon]